MLIANVQLPFDPVELLIAAVVQGVALAAVMFVSLPAWGKLVLATLVALNLLTPASPKRHGR